MAGYSDAPLPRRLGVRDDRAVFLDGVPPSVRLGDLGGAHVVRRLPRMADVVLTFQVRPRALESRLPLLTDRTASGSPARSMRTPFATSR